MDFLFLSWLNRIRLHNKYNIIFIKLKSKYISSVNFIIYYSNNVNNVYNFIYEESKRSQETLDFIKANHTNLINNDYKTTNIDYRTDIFGLDLINKSHNKQSDRAKDFAEGVKSKENFKFIFDCVSIGIIIILTAIALFGNI